LVKSSSYGSQNEEVSLPGLLPQHLFDGLAEICAVLIRIFCDVYVASLIVFLDVFTERVEITMDDVW
jgi:hypothetical protein